MKTAAAAGTSEMPDRSAIAGIDKKWTGDRIAQLEHAGTLRKVPLMQGSCPPGVIRSFAPSTSPTKAPPLVADATYFSDAAFCARTAAHRFFEASAMARLPAAESLRFFRAGAAFVAGGGPACSA
jgi:hypothetical protein